METFLKILWYLFLCILFIGLCVLCTGGSYASAPESAPESAPNSAEEKDTVFFSHGQLYDEEADLIVRAVAFASRGSMRIAGKNPERTAAPYAARVGMIATILNRMADPRFPDSAARVIFSDKTFSPTAFAVEFSDDDLALTRAALETALNGFDPTDGALYFSTPTEWVNRFAVTCAFGGYSFGVPQ